MWSGAHGCNAIWGLCLWGLNVEVDNVLWWLVSSNIAL